MNYLDDAIDLWYDLHGKTLSNSKARLRNLLSISQAFKNPPIKDVTPLLWFSYRAERLNLGITKKTLNNELGYLRAVYNFLIKINQVDCSNPLAAVSPFKLDEVELSFLSLNQIERLLESLRQAVNPHVYLIALTALKTGARWSEVQNLTLARVNHCRVTFTKTKSKKIRVIAIEKDLEQMLISHLTKYKNFTSSIGAFRTSINRAKIVLPKGQCSHVLRHTYASHFMMNGGNLFTLQRILGHCDTKLTSRYAHLSKDHLLEAVKFSPQFKNWSEREDLNL